RLAGLNLVFHPASNRFKVNPLRAAPADRRGAVYRRVSDFRLAIGRHDLLQKDLPMAAIGRFQKGDEIFYAKVVDGELFRLQGDVFGSPSYEKKPVPLKGVKTLTPVNPSKVIAVDLNYADHARESGKPI